MPIQDETSKAANEGQAERLTELRQILDDLITKRAGAHGPDAVILAYETAVVAQQYKSLACSMDTVKPPIPLVAKLRASALENPALPEIRAGLWECNTLIVPVNARDFRQWMWATLSSVVKDFSKDWQEGYAMPGVAVFIHKRIAEKREAEVQPGVWVIDVDVEGWVVGCDPFLCGSQWCEPNRDAGTMILVEEEQVLESNLSFMLLTTGDCTEVRLYCGARQLAQQYDAIKTRILYTWPGTRVSAYDTDISFRGMTNTAKWQAPDVPALESIKHPVAQGTPGRPRSEWDEWARGEVHRKGRDKKTVYEEWLRNEERTEALAHPRDSFSHMIKNPPRTNKKKPEEID